jgi:uncharacterized UBP type Zn finger protein
MMPPALES